MGAADWDEDWDKFEEEGTLEEFIMRISDFYAFLFYLICGELVTADR